MFVQLVIAAMVTDPLPSSDEFPFNCTSTLLSRLAPFSVFSLSEFSNDSFSSFSETLSCGRLGPAMEGSTVEISSSRVSV